jgi:hypothetical protein
MAHDTGMKTLGAAFAVAGALLVVVSGPVAFADPPAMREEAADPSIQVESQDGAHALAVGGFLQARAQRFVPEADTDLPSLGLPRTRLYLFGRVHSQIRYRFMIGTLPYQETIRIFDAYAEWAPSSSLRLRAGRFKIPVLRGWIESGRELATIERAPAVLSLLPGRAMGALASFRAFDDRLELSLGGFDRRGDPAHPEGVGPRSVAGRALWNVQGRPIEGELDLERQPFTLALGGSGAHTFEGRDAQDVNEWIAAFDVAARVRGFDAMAEVAIRGRGGSQQRVLAAYARVDYYVSAIRTALGGRVSHTMALTGQAFDHHEIELDVAYLPHGHDMKLVGAVLARRTTGTGWHPGLAAQLQVAF